MYYKSLPEGIEPEDYNFDEPDALDFELVFENFKNLLKGKEIKIPFYDFKTHKRISFKKIKVNPKMIIMEGIFLFYFQKLRDKLNFKIFLESSRNQIIKRRFKRDFHLRGSDKKFILKQLEKYVFPGNEKFVEGYKKYSDLILPFNLSIKEKIQIISNEINKILLKYLNEN